MRYPTLTTQTAQALMRQRLAGEPAEVMSRVHWMGRGDEIDLSVIESCATTIAEALDEFRDGPQARDLDRFEGQASGLLHQALSPLAPESLDDPGLWRFLTLQYFWSFVLWRERSAFESGDYGRYRQYVDGSNPAECVLFRMFLRGQLVEQRGTYELGDAIPFAADFWRSHVLRVRTAGAPTVARAFARSHAEDRMATDDLRTVARRLNRIWTNVVLYTYDDHEADALVAELRDDLFAE